MALVPQNGKKHRPSGRPGGSTYKGDRVRLTIRVPRSWFEQFTEIAEKEEMPLCDLIVRWTEEGL